MLRRTGRIADHEKDHSGVTRGKTAPTLTETGGRDLLE
jgi:hypothetical protein